MACLLVDGGVEGAWLYHVFPVLVLFGAGEALVGCVEVAVGFEAAVVAFDVCSGPALSVGLLVLEAVEFVEESHGAEAAFERGENVAECGLFAHMSLQHVAIKRGFGGWLTLL